MQNIKPDFNGSFHVVPKTEKEKGFEFMLDVILKRVACLTNQRSFNLIMGLKLKRDVTKLTGKHNIGIRRATAKYKYTYINT